MLITPQINRTGDKFACNKWLGRARAELAYLERIIALSATPDAIKQQIRNVSPERGVSIRCYIGIGISNIHIHVDPISSDVEKAIVELAYISIQIKRTYLPEDAIGTISALTKSHGLDYEPDTPCTYTASPISGLIEHKFISDFAQTRYVTTDGKIASLIIYNWASVSLEDTKSYVCVRVVNESGCADFEVSYEITSGLQISAALSNDLKTLYIAQGRPVDNDVGCAIYRLADDGYKLERVVLPNDGTYDVISVVVSRNGVLGCFRDKNTTYEAVNVNTTVWSPHDPSVPPNWTATVFTCVYTNLSGGMYNYGHHYYNVETDVYDSYTEQYNNSNNFPYKTMMNLAGFTEATTSGERKGLTWYNATATKDLTPGYLTYQSYDDNQGSDDNYTQHFKLGDLALGRTHSGSFSSYGYLFEEHGCVTDETKWSNWDKETVVENSRAGSMTADFTRTRAVYAWTLIGHEGISYHQYTDYGGGSCLGPVLFR